MNYTIVQMMSAEAGMYLVNGRDATLVVMWALVERSVSTGSLTVSRPVQRIIGLTVTDLEGDLQDNLNDRWLSDAEYSTKVNNQSHNVTR